jgi:hypothetical protein
MLFGAYALHGRDPMIYERTPVLAGQCFYLFATEGNPDDKALVEAAYELDVTSRPSNARAQATVALRDYTYARFHGDLEEAARQAEAAIISLARFRLPRHLRVVTQQGYLAA